MSIFDDKMEDSVAPILWPTGTLLDFMSGWYERGVDHKWYLVGGLPQGIFGLHGRENTFKSTVTDGFRTGAMHIHKDSYGFDVDTEGIKSKTRVMSSTNDLLHDDGEDLDRRLALWSGSEYHIDRLHEELKDMVKKKAANEKSQIVEIPLIDPKTGKPRKTFIPTFFQIDSLTELTSNEEAMMLNQGGIEDGKNKTIYLVDGNKKTLLTHWMRSAAEKYGFCFICTGHTGDNMSMDPRQPPAKQLMHMKQKDRIKGVGSRFTFLTHVLLQNMAQRPCTNSAKTECNYPQGITPTDDLVEISTVVQRNKSNASGTVVPFIASQTYGLRNTVTNLNFIRANGYAGLIGGPSHPKHSCVWYPDVKFSRKSVRDQCDDDYALCRAIELTAQYRFIQTYWNLSKLPFDFTMTAEQIFDKLTTSKAVMKDMLQTTGNWSYKKGEREYLSLFDLLELISS